MAFVRARGGDGSDVVSAVVLHWFKMRRKKKKKRKTCLNVLVEPSFFCKVVVTFSPRHLPHGYDYMGKRYLVMDFSSVSDQSARVSHVR